MRVRKIASSETTVVSPENGNGSKARLSVFQRIQAANQITWAVTNHRRLAWDTMKSLARTAVLLRASDSFSSSQTAAMLRRAWAGADVSPVVGLRGNSCTLGCASSNGHPVNPKKE